MPRPQWPPDYVNGSIHVLLDDSVPDGAYRLYQKLCALAWGEPTLSISFDRLMELTALSRTRIYEYARILRLRRGLLSYVVRNNAFECSFFPTVKNPGKRDLLSPLGLGSELPTNQVPKSKPPTSRNPGKRDNGQIPAGAGTNAIKDEYVRLLGYKPLDWVQGEATAAKEIGEHYTVEQFRAAYQHYKGQEFWKDKRLTMRHLKTQIPEFLRSKNGRQVTAPAVPVGLTPEQQQLRALIMADREKKNANPG